jgi:nucleoid DNA-binding protein
MAAKKVATGDLIEMVYSKSEGFSKADIKGVVNLFLDTAIDVLKAGGDVQFRGLGDFKVKQRKGRTLKSPIDGKVHQVPARKAISFRVSSPLKAGMNA